MHGGMVDLKFAQVDRRAPETQKTDACAEMVDAGVGSFIGGLSAMNDESRGFRFKREKTPVEAGNLDTAACGLFKLCDQSAAGDVFKLRRTHPDVEATGDQRNHNHETGQRERNMAKKKTSKTARARLLGRFLLSRDGDFRLAHGLAFPSPFRAAIGVLACGTAGAVS